VNNEEKRWLVVGGMVVGVVLAFLLGWHVRGTADRLCWTDDGEVCRPKAEASILAPSTEDSSDDSETD